MKVARPEKKLQRDEVRREMSFLQDRAERDAEGGNSLACLSKNKRCTGGKSWFADLGPRGK